MKTSIDSQKLVGKSLVLLIWKYPREPEIRRKVYMTEWDYDLLRKILCKKETEMALASAQERNTYYSDEQATLSTELTTILQLNHLITVQLVGHVPSPK